MATGPRDGSVFGIHLDSVPEKGVKGSETDSAEKTGPVAQDGNIKGFWEGIAPARVKEEPDDGLQQRWEAQWRQFLKVVETSGSEEGHSRQQGHSGCSQSLLNVGLQLIGDEVPQLLFGSFKERQEPDDASLAEFPDEEGYEEVIQGNVAVGWEVERQRFRQHCYQETTGPKETYEAVRDLCHGWLKPERCTKEQILEQVILEQFLAILPQEMQSWVKAHHPDSCPRAVALAEGFLLIQEQKVPGPLQKEVVSSPKDEGPPWDSGEWPLFREIKQEQDSNPTVPEDSKRNHTGRKLYKCADCGKNFHQSCDLIRHKRIHTGEKPYKCSVCEKQFSQRSYLVVHERSHTNEKPYKCYLCGKSFCTSVYLRNHQRTHTGERPYQCPDCGKRFATSSNFVNHKKTHTEDRPYHCSLCKKSFKRSSASIQHEKTHTGEKPYSCLTCGENFISNSSLVKHQQSHTGERPCRSKR